MHHTSFHLQVVERCYFIPQFYILGWWKVLHQEYLAQSFHMVIESGGKEFNHTRAQSLNEYGKSLESQCIL